MDGANLMLSSPAMASENKWTNNIFVVQSKSLYKNTATCIISSKNTRNLTFTSKVYA